MIQSILGGVAAAIGEAYPGVDILTERPSPDLQPPYFYLEAVKPEERAEHDRRFRLTAPVRVHYHPRDGTDPRGECEAVAGKLYGLLEFIQAEGLRRGYQATHSVTEDGVLMFDVTYKAFYLRTETPPQMQTMELGLKASGTIERE